MSKEKNLPQAEDMRQIIKNIFELSKKLSFKIPVTDLQDAANLAAMIYGFNSWKEYKTYLNKESLKIQIKNPNIKIKRQVFNDIILSELIPFDLSQLKDLELSKFLLKETKNKLLPEFLIGNSTNKIMKVREPKAIKQENTFITGSPTSGINNFFSNHVKWLVNHKQTFVIFGSEEQGRIFSELKNTLQENKIQIIGKDYITLDPLVELIQSNEAESFFNIKDDKNSSFSFLWLQIVRKIISEHNKKPNIKDAITLTKLTSLLEIYKLWKDSDQLLSSWLYKYLFDYCGIQIENEQYIISSSSMEKHFMISHELSLQLEEINLLYKEGVFTENSSDSLTKSIFNKESVFIIKERNQCYMDILSKMYMIAFTKHTNELKYINPQPYKFWSLWWEGEQWINEHNALGISKMNEATVKIVYVNSQFNNLQNLLNTSNQIIFLRQNLEGYSRFWKDKMLCQTNNLSINFWYDNCKVLRELENNECILWQLIDTQCNPEDVNEYQLDKVELYDEVIF